MNKNSSLETNDKQYEAVTSQVATLTQRVTDLERRLQLLENNNNNQTEEPSGQLLNDFDHRLKLLENASSNHKQTEEPLIDVAAPDDNLQF